MKRATRGIARCMLLAGAIVVLGAPSASPADALHWIGTWRPRQSLLKQQEPRPSGTKPYA
jgi:hypothetical protein